MDTEIWEKIRQGDKDAFMQLYQGQYQQLFTFGCRVHANRELVKDCIHEMFCEIWNGRQNVQQVSNSRAYLFTYLKRKILKELQKVGSPQHALAPEQLEQHTHELSYEDLLIGSQADEEVRAKLQKVLQKLTKTQLEVIRLKYYESLSYEEVATALQIQPRTAYNQVYEALKLLRKYMRVIVLLGVGAQDFFQKFFL
ncbi:MAG: sigma-70 family RNA polymerase sigma factor [Hymenobacteraceae bacterium]|nr:sigma-70 family RNA polymerase sigma factor [Hymenobacteraceae bacterium]MDX5482046.1 sigma-70 family RNA polymerase sigma factor [Hymenobacteraceae bacterium]